MSDDLDARWADGLATGVLSFPRCAACGSWNWYPLPGCGACQGREFDWVPVAPRGRIYSWTRTHFDFRKRRALAQPLVVAIVEIDEAPIIRIPVRQAVPGEPPRIGDAVDLAVLQTGEEACWSYHVSAGSRDRR